MSLPTRLLRPLLGLAVTVLFLWLFLRQLDGDSLGALFTRLSPSMVVGALLFLAAGYTLRVVRWWWMLRLLEPTVPLRACGWPFLVSIALNNLLPFRAGDMARVVGFRRQLNAPPMGVLGTLVVERLLDLLTLLGLFFVGLWGGAGDALPAGFVWITSAIAAGGIATVAALLRFSPQIERLIHWLAHRPLFAERGWSATLVDHGGHFLRSLHTVRAPAVVFRLLLVSLLIWILEGGVYLAVARDLVPGAALLAPWFSLATGTLATLLPSSPGYVGTFDYFAMLGMVAYGAERSAAAAFAVAVHLMLWTPLTLAGLAYFLRPANRTLRRRLSGALTEEGGLK
ncbi:lysylphosphatidylglycerol synthase transmembrane domain-containing protein [Endothiovibrio diazotrophicus]